MKHKVTTIKQVLSIPAGLTFLHLCTLQCVPVTQLSTSWVHYMGSFILHSTTNICESSVWDTFHSNLTHEMLKCLPDFKMYIPLTKVIPYLTLKTNDTKVWTTFAYACRHDFPVQTAREHISKQQGEQPHRLCEQNMKHHYYCTVASLRCDKTFNRLPEVLHHCGF